MKIRMCKFIILLIFLLTLPSFSGEDVIKVGDQVPAAIITDSKGNPVNLADHIGKRTIILWVTDLCAVCLEGLDNFQNLYDKFSNSNVSIFMIGTSNEKTTKDFIKKYDVSFPVLMGGKDSLLLKLTGESGIGICPIDNFFVIDKKGVLRHRKHLPGIPDRELENIVNSVL